jgi:hypothetical protein
MKVGPALRTSSSKLGLNTSLLDSAGISLAVDTIR